MSNNSTTHENDAPILIVFGQSNAHGHGTRLPKELQIRTPLKNVKGLSREFNQAYNLQDVKWTGYTSHSMNLGESQDHTYCLSTEFARLWQNEIDSGNKLNLADLYIVQISIGGQGIAEVETFGNMWYINRVPSMISGNLSEVNISLYPLAIQILKLVMANLKNSNKVPRIIGLHWNQWETEVDTGAKSITEAKQNYTKLFNGFKQTIGEPFPIYLYRPLSEVYNKPDELLAIRELFDEFVRNDETFNIIDISKSSLWNEDLETKGIFKNDYVHYVPEAYLWFAKHQFDIYKSQNL